MSIFVRPATIHDCDAIKDIQLQAFPDEEGRLIARLASDLLNEESDPATITLVADLGDEIVGHIAFSPVFGGASCTCLGYILAPLAVNPAHHKKGIGSMLVKTGINQLSDAEVDLFFVYGDPKFYQRFGFEVDSALSFAPPYELAYPFGWQVLQRCHESSNERSIPLSCVEALQNPALW